MSGIFKAVKKVFKATGLGALGSSAVKVAKKVVKTKAFKIAAIAAVAYFGGAALMSLANGGTVASGLSSAWTGVQSAGSALMSGNFSGAAKALSTGFTGSGSAATAAKIAATAAPTATTTAAATTAPTAGLLGLGEAGTSALITSGVNMAGQMIQGHAAEKQAEEQRKNLNYFGVNGSGNGGGLPMPGLLTPNLQPTEFNTLPQQPRTIDELIKRQQQQVNQYPTWG